MLNPIQTARFAADGFLKGERVLDSAQVEALRSELARIIANRDGALDPSAPQPVRIDNLTGDPAAPVWQIVNIWEASPAYCALVHHPGIVDDIAQLTQAQELRVWHDQIQYQPAFNGGINRWHQDWPYWPVLSQPTQVTAWVALDDVDQDNGCMSMVPGSHRWGNTID